MKIVNVAVHDGIAEVTKNPHKLNVKIVDSEYGDYYVDLEADENANVSQIIEDAIKDILKNDPNAVILKVWRCIAEVEHCPEDVEVRIKDYDEQ